MSLKNLVILRKFSISAFRRSLLSADYKSKALWEERYNCKLLTNDDIVNGINSKIIMGGDLSNLETDIFINIAAPRTDEIAQLQETVKLLARFRKSLYAITLLPSTPHAVCRLFLDSQRLDSLISLLEQRTKFGIFPDMFALNLLIDAALNKENFALASRFASLVMIQEEFGLNPLTDSLALYSIAKYIESKADFSDWASKDPSNDPILTGEGHAVEDTAEKNAEQTTEKADVEDDEEDEDDAEYIRVPFLRNPYFDAHFDLKSHRVICGKTLSMLGKTIKKQDAELGTRCELLGGILMGNWLNTNKNLDEFVESKFKLGPSIELAKFYIENSNDIDPPNDDQKASLLSRLGKISTDGCNLSEMALSRCKSFSEHEKQDIQNLKANIMEWTQKRITTKEAQERAMRKKELIAEIEAKKD